MTLNDPCIHTLVCTGSVLNDESKLQNSIGMSRSIFTRIDAAVILWLWHFNVNTDNQIQLDWGL